jgi:hypothetical protein
MPEWRLRGGYGHRSRSVTGFPSGGYSPQALRRAYGVSALLRAGIDGRGETVVLPEKNAGLGAPPPGTGGISNIRQNLAPFDTRYHLPPVDRSARRVRR